MNSVSRERKFTSKKVGNAVVLLPMGYPWEALFASLALFTDDFMENREQPPEQHREATFG
jgi:antitoxin VapB